MAFRNIFLSTIRSCKLIFILNPNSIRYVRRMIKCGIYLPKTSLTSSFLIGIALFKRIDSNKKELNATLVEADKLYIERKFESIQSLLENYETVQNEEILWRLARATYEIGNQKKNKKEQLKELEIAFALIEKALKINEQNGYVHKWYAILLNSILSHKGVKEKINGGNNIKKHLEAAIKYIPSDPTSYYLLGYWFYTVADLTWYERKIASLIYATPPSNSFEEALACFEKAEKIEPLFYNMNLLMLGKCYLKIKQNDKAKEFLTKAKDYPSITSEDEKIREEASSLLKYYKLT